MSQEYEITSRAEDYSAWYNDIVRVAELADHSPVKGCMVIRPYGFGIWELVKEALDRRIKETGHRNAYFPLLIPQSFMEKEADHVEGFAPECAVVTHGGGKELDEPLYIRPTSETIIYDAYARWVESYRDLPVLVNQWANVLRWEMRTRLFLRTTEFLWQEGHTAHETEPEAEAEARKMLEVYREVVEEVLGIPVLTGRKTESEKFAGARHTYAIEAMMQDGKALQAGTSHNLGQSFAKAFDLTFQGREGEHVHAWNTSWGVSTRLIGGLIMTHSDDDGLVLPPAVAPIQVVCVPIYKNDEQRGEVLKVARNLLGALEEQRTERTTSWPALVRGTHVRTHLDDRDNLRPGAKFYEWERKGVPIRVEIGPRDLKKDQVCVVRRDTMEKEFVKQDAFVDRFASLLEEIQANLFERARTFRADHTREVDSKDELAELVDEGGFGRGLWCGDPTCETALKDDLQTTIRVIPFDAEVESGSCIECGDDVEDGRVVLAKAY